MKLHRLAILIICAVVQTAQAEEAIVMPDIVAHTQHKSGGVHWTDYPLIEENRFSSRKRAIFVVKNLEASTAQIFPPTGKGQFPEKYAIRGDGSAYPVTLKNGRFAISPERRGNYYWAMVQSKTAQSVITANTVKYFTAPGPAPNAMLAVDKSRLQLIPDPLPREHWRYREGETWSFKLSFDGQPLSNVEVQMQTQQGLHQQLTSDENGVVRVTFPNDIVVSKAQHANGHHRRPSSQFVLMAKHTDAGIAHHTTFNYQYGASAMHGKSLNAGFGFMALGGIFALPLLIPAKNKKKGGRNA